MKSDRPRTISQIALVDPKRAERMNDVIQEFAARPPVPKSVLTKKQKKSRKRSKLAKQSRKINRK